MSNQQYVIADTLKQLGLNILSHDAETQTNWDILKGYIKIVEHKAQQSKRYDVLDMLWSAGLVYG